MIQLIFVRHGETDSNKRGTYCGWTDLELNEEGIKQTCNARDKLKGVRIDAFFSSPLKRALRTAEIINENFGLRIECFDALKERNFGIWEDLSYKEVCQNFPELAKRWEADWVNYCIEGGESALQFYSRVTEFVNDLIKKSKDGVFLLVTHLGCIRNILSYLLGMGIEGNWRFRVNCGSITKVEINDEGYAYLTLLNG